MKARVSDRLRRILDDPQAADSLRDALIRRKASFEVRGKTYRIERRSSRPEARPKD